MRALCLCRLPRQSGLLEVSAEGKALKERAIMVKRHLIAAGYAIALPVSSTVVILLVAAGIEGAVTGVRRHVRR